MAATTSLSRARRRTSAPPPLPNPGPGAAVGYECDPLVGGNLSVGGDDGLGGAAPPPSPVNGGDALVIGSYTFRLADRVTGRRLVRGEVKPQYGGRPRAITAKMVEAEDMPAFLAEEGSVLHVLHNHPHPGVPPLRATVQAAPGDRSLSFLLMDDMDTNLAAAVNARGRLSEAEARGVMRQLASTVAHCHKHRVVLRDLRLERVCTMDPNSLNVVIADLDGAHTVASPGPLLIRGRVGMDQGSSYVCPESLANRPYDGAAADSWSLGVMLYTMLTGSLPFVEGRRALYEKMQRASADLRFPPHISFAARGLICQLLDRDPRMRPTAAAILEEPWVRHSEAEDMLPGPMSLGVPRAPGSHRGSRRGSVDEPGEPDQVVPGDPASPSKAQRQRQLGGAKRKARMREEPLGPALRRRLAFLQAQGTVRPELLIITAPSHRGDGGGENERK